jgi:uncharacterized protein
VHISRLADRYVRDPHEVVGVGDVLSLWVIGVDRERRRVSLTAIRPGTEKPRQERRGGGPKRSSARAEREGGSRRPRQRGEKGPAARPRGQRKRVRTARSAAPPKPIVPITKEMEEGKEPMRTFSDLKQFYEKKSDSGSKDDKSSTS